MNLKEALGYVTQLRDLWRFQRSRPRPPQTYQRIRPEDFR
jgi:hypothetical protein